MYSSAVRQMMELVLHLQRSMVITKITSHQIEFVSMNHSYRWNGSELYIGKSIKLKLGLSVSEDKNFISTNSQRLNIKFNNTNFYTFLSSEMTAMTSDMMVDEGTYHQHMIFADLPDYNEVLGIYKVSKELVENNVSYFGSYRIPLLDMGHVARQLEYRYPETKGFWGRYLNYKMNFKIN